MRDLQVMSATMEESNTEHHFVIADISRRAIATFVDYALYLSFYTLFLLGFGSSELIDGRLAYSLEGPLSVVPLVVWFVTFPVMESYEGMSIGKRMMKLRVVKTDGSAPGFLDTVKRRIADWVDFAFLGLPAIISSRNSSLSQRLGDRWAGTTVIDTRFTDTA